MATHEALTLDGCAPTPLASYLKALGILRLISSDANHVSGRAADPKARGWWENERFHLRTETQPRRLVPVLSVRLCTESHHWTVERACGIS